MKRTTTSLLAIFIVLGARGQAPKQNRIGTFDRPSVVVAYYRSALWDATVRNQRIALAKAKKGSDAAQLRALTATEKKSRMLPHNQLENGAPITNILEALKPAFDEIEKQEHLSDIVQAPASDPKAKTVDVTAKLLDWLKADDETRKVIEQYKAKGAASPSASTP